MYAPICCPCQWHHPMQYSWNNTWRYDGLPRYMEWNTRSYSPYYGGVTLQDYGTKPLVINMEQVAKKNQHYRIALWTGAHCQVTLMSIRVGGDIGLEVHPATDQFIRIEEGQGFVQMGDSRDHLNVQAIAHEDYAIMIPAGKWHNITNTGQIPLKVSVIYAPPEHPYGTVQETQPIP